MNNCPTLPDHVFQDEGCAPSFSGLGSTIYIGPAMPDGSLPKLSDMTAVELPADYDNNLYLSEKEPSESGWNTEGFTQPFEMTITPEDKETQRKLFDRLWGTAGLTRKRIVRERKAYNRFRRSVKNPIRRMVLMYQKQLHKGVVRSMPIAIAFLMAKNNYISKEK